MITRIELTNFMSHVHTVIEPAAGLTVLVGPNNCGKSAVVAALQILAHNENSTYVLRHGTKECSVKITTDDGHEIEWKRKKSPSYVIDKQTFDRLRGSTLPEELQRALRLPLVDGGGEGQFDVHFGEQKSPIFLLDKSPATAARFFASSSDAIRLVQMQRRHKDKVAQRQRDKNRLEAESRQLNQELAALLPAIDLDEQLQQVEQLHSVLVQEAGRLVQAERDQAALAEQLAAVARHDLQARTLAPLKSPPELLPTEPLENLAASLARGETDLSQSQARLQALATLASPPALADEAGLATLIAGLTNLAATAEREEYSQRTLLALVPPPALDDTTELARVVDRLTAARRNADASEARQRALADVAAPPELSDERALAELATQLAAVERKCARWSAIVQSSAIEPPSLPVECQSLAECVTQLERASELANRLTGELQSAAAALADVETELRELAASESCPLCGSPLDADRLLAGAALGSGGHNHG
jgi:energy-coupling factor transporter ATP-binding protein EcfA2